MRIVMAGRSEIPGVLAQDEILFASQHAAALERIEAGGAGQTLLIDPETFDDDAFALIAEVREKHPSVPILVALAPDDAALAMRCAAASVTDLVATPICWDFMRQRLPILLRTHQAKLEAQAGMRFALSHDLVTGLPNRAGACRLLEEALSAPRRTGGILGVLCVKLRGFGRVSEAVGVEGADHYLCEIAQRLQTTLRRGDILAQIDGNPECNSASRLGGDSFGVFVSGLRDPSDAARVARRVIDAASAAIEVDGHIISCSANVGISMFPEDARDPDSLLQHAESAARFLEEHARNGFEYYSPEISADAWRQLNIETELRSAIDLGEVQLHYQPKVDLRSGCLSGMEALIRWKSASLGAIKAHELIQAAERTGLIGEIGRWVLWEACARNREWQETDHRRVPVSVNVSASQLCDPEFEQNVMAALTGTGLDPRYLHLEVTESILIEDSEGVANKLAELRSTGIGVALDDFGAGYASLAYLTRYPLDVLKLDRQFIVGMTSNPGMARIVASVVELAQFMGMRVVAEGVDDPDQIQLLEECACDEIQGFLVSGALPHDEFASYLERTRGSKELWLLEEKRDDE